MSMSIIAALGLVGEVASAANKGLPVLDAIDDKGKRSLLATHGRITDLIGQLILEPKIVVVDTLRNHDYIEAAIDMQISFFIALYSRAFERLLRDKGIELDSALNLLSSRRDVTLTSKIGHAIEQYSTLVDIATEATEFLPLSFSTEASKNEDTGRLPLFIKTFRLSLDLRDGHKINMEFMVRAPIQYVKQSDIKFLLDTQDKRSKSFFARVDEWRAGAITRTNLILADDLIRERKKRKLREQSDIVKDLEKRTLEANAKLLTEGAVGFGKYYQMLILDKPTKVMVENKIGEKLSKERGKEAFLEDAKSLSVTVMDDSFDTAIMYVNGLTGGSEVTYKSFKKDKDGSNGLSEVMKFLLQRGM